jgi:hypothetical protein
LQPRHSIINPKNLPARYKGVVMLLNSACRYSPGQTSHQVVLNYTDMTMLCSYAYINSRKTQKNGFVRRKHITTSVRARKTVPVYLEHLKGDCVLLKFWKQELHNQNCHLGLSKDRTITDNSHEKKTWFIHKQLPFDGSP